MSIADKQDCEEIRSLIGKHEERIISLESWREEIVHPLCDQLEKLTAAIKGDEYGNKGLIKTVENFDNRVQNIDARLRKIDHLKWWVLGAVGATSIIIPFVWSQGRAILEAFHR